MERTEIIKDLRTFYADRSIENFSIQLEDEMCIFFDDLRCFKANREQDVVSSYIVQTILDVEEGEKLLERKYAEYRNTHNDEDMSNINSIEELQKEYTKKLKHKLKFIVSGKSVEEAKSIFYVDEMNAVAYSELLVEYGDVLTQKEVCDIFHVTSQTIRNWRKEGWLTPSIEGKFPKYLKSEIKEVLIRRFPQLIVEHSKVNRR